MPATTQLSTSQFAPVISFRLPYPTSVNDMLGHGRGRVFRSKEYKAWLKEAHGEWLLQRNKLPVKKIEGRYRICIYASPPALNRRRDAGNLEKATSDFLVMVGVFRDDHLSKSVFTEWDDDPSPTSSIRIEITPYP